MSMTSCFFVFFIKSQKKQEAPLDLLFFFKKQEVSPKKQTPSCFFEASDFTRESLSRDIE